MLRRFDRSAYLRFAFQPALLLAAAAGLCLAPQQANSAPPAQSADLTVRICLDRTFAGHSKLYVSRAAGSYQISAATTDALWVGGSNSKLVAEISDEQLVEFQSVSAAPRNAVEKVDASHLIYHLAAGQTVLLAQSDPPDADPDVSSDAFCLQVDSEHAAHHYRGAMQITALADGTLRVINSVPLEQYLKGVVGPEIGEAAPLEALKAQAIAARTYTIKNIGKLAFIGADLDDTNRCQNYLGVDAENWRCRTAVEQTSGEVLTYQGSLIDAVYATDCGGMTAEGDEPYLKSVADPECAGASPWSVTVAVTALQSALAKCGVSEIANIDSVAVHDRDVSGRVSTLTCIDEATGVSEDVSATLVRKALGYDLLRSTLFTVSMAPAESEESQKRDCAAPTTGTVTFTGKGWGHGLGMCQHGAVEMAKSDGATDEQILHHFYFGVAITNLTTDLVADAAAKAVPSAWSMAGLAAFAAGQSPVNRSESEDTQPTVWPARSTRSGSSAARTNKLLSPAIFPRRGF